jgi:hypothetical protein
MRKRLPSYRHPIAGTCLDRIGECWRLDRVTVGLQGSDDHLNTNTIELPDSRTSRHRFGLLVMTQDNAKCIIQLYTGLGTGAYTPLAA